MDIPSSLSPISKSIPVRPPCRKCKSSHVDRKGYPLCSAHVRKRDENGGYVACRSRPISGRNTCRLHGGMAKVGPANGAFKHGLFSKALPSRYMAAFDKTMRDPAYLSLRRQIALADSRELELVKRLDSGESGASWAALATIIEDLRTAYADNRPVDFSIIVALINRGLSDERQWAELASNSETRRRLAETERKRIESAQAYLTVEEIALAAGYFAGLLKRYVKEPSELRAAGEEMAAFFDAWRVPAGMKRGPRAVRVGKGRNDVDDEGVEGVGGVDGVEGGGDLIDAEVVE